MLPLMAAVSCTDDNNESVDSTSASVIVIDTTVIEAVPAGGGTLSVSYVIESPVEGVKVEAVSPAVWLGTPNTSVDGIITFDVERNTGEWREGSVTVMYGSAESLTFTITQYGANTVTLEDLTDKYFSARICQFDRTETIFYHCNPTNPGEIWTSNPITAGEYADNYARDYNLDNPDDLTTAEDWLVWEYTIDWSIPLGTSFDIDFDGDSLITTVHSNWAPAGSGHVTDYSGPFEYDERTGEMIIINMDNTELPDGYEVRAKFWKEGNEIVYECTYVGFPDDFPYCYYFQHYDRFGFTIPGYGTDSEGNYLEVFQPWKKMTYYLEESEPKNFG
ncbi:MAG TPA: hypothetical protein IAC03_03675 [Candidatus Coprenecus pullistercoris]|nr:hypothetical protein [Candidatus Coprenecus pullistercoris]